MVDVLKEQIRYFDQPAVVSCDGRCDFAFGVNGGPRHYYADPKSVDDDYVFLPDRLVARLVGRAPPPGETVIASEGDDRKPSAVPLTDPGRTNRWCVRECERSRLTAVGEGVELRDFERPVPNMPHRRSESAPWETGEPVWSTPRRP